jgi:sulfite exporter TauE/SafE
MAQTPKLYYTNARYGGKTALLAGPFLTAEEAGHCIDLCGPLAVAFDPMLEKASFGVMECSGYAGQGHFNETLAMNGINGILTV